MADIFDRSKRSAVMARIRGSGNKDTELQMIRLFRAQWVRGWRRNARVFGKPDFVFPKEKVAVFVDGCFWHRHPGCKFSYTPKSRLEFWLPKFQKNVARDRLVTSKLRKAGWRVLRIWECQLARKKQARVVRRLKAALSGRARLVTKLPP